MSTDWAQERSVVSDSGCWLWQGYKNGSGYGVAKYKGQVCRAHRLSYEKARGRIPEGLHVLHKCDVRHCVNPDHLFLGTNQDNVDDRERKGRNKPIAGEGHQWAKLTDSQVEAIRCLQSKASAVEVAERFSVHRSLVYRIWRGERRNLSK